MRVCEIGLEAYGAPKRVDRAVHVVRRLQSQPEVVPRGGVIGLERERSAIGVQCIRFAIRRSISEPEVVVEFRLARRRLHGSLEQRQRGVELVALIMNDTKIMAR